MGPMQGARPLLIGAAVAPAVAYQATEPFHFQNRPFAPHFLHSASHGGEPLRA